ncbi:MAG TPA: hypothetical protein VIJ93_07455 [bacterium]
MKKLSLLLIVFFSFSVGLNFVGCGSSPTTNPAVPTPTPGPMILCASPSSQGVTTTVTGGGTLAGFLVADKVILASNETATTISLYIGSGPVSGQVRFAIYNDNAGSPGNLVIEANPQNVVASSWNSASLSNIFLPAGTYWLAYQLSNGVPNIGLVAWVAQKYASYSWGTFPDTAPATSNDGYDVSIYITTCP